jgi:hypothetical protein
MISTCGEPFYDPIYSSRSCFHLALSVVRNVLIYLGDPDHVLRLEELRVRADDVARSLDLEDGSGTITAKLGPVEATWTVEEGVERLMYSATFYETS